jgi:GrpB-like predicted nucleotidyltransferase (UPF0157 family)
MTENETAGHQVVVAAYDPGWPARAAALIATLTSRLGPLAARIEHIGSTSIPGMAAKDLIDLQVSTPDLAAVEAAFDPPLAELGFTLMPYRRDHVPAGRPDSPDLWVKRLWSRSGHPDGSVNLHVRGIGSPNERLALLFRDWFRAHPEAIPAYGGFKQSLAGLVEAASRSGLDDDAIGAYSDTKDWVVDVVIAAAEPWADATGWRP